MESEEEDIYCSKCGEKTEEALMLACEHNLCLLCASKILKNQKIKNNNLSQLIKCNICKTPTELEPETINQILSAEKNSPNEENENYVIDNIDNYYFLDLEDNNKNQNQNQNQRINNKKNINNNANQNQNITSSEINIINDLMPNNIINTCKEHGEILNYLCLDCMTNCVCSECIVHGIHRNHEVLNIKKAYPLIYGKMQDLSKYVNEQIKEFSLVSDAITKKKNFINVLTERCKNEIHNTFEQIRIRLDNKEKEITNNTTNI